MNKLESSIVRLKKVLGQALPPKYQVLTYPDPAKAIVESYLKTFGDEGPDRLKAEMPYTPDELVPYCEKALATFRQMGYLI